MILVNNGYSPTRILEEIAKCEVRCRNCHARVSSERRKRDWRSDLMTGAGDEAEAPEPG